SLSPLSFLLDVENRLAGNPPVAQQRAGAGDIAPAMLGNARGERAVRDQPGQEREIRAEAVLGLRSEIVEGLDSGVLVLGKVAKIERRRLTRGIAEGNDRAAMVDPLDGGSQRGAAGGLEDQAEATLGRRDRGDDL